MHKQGKPSSLFLVCKLFTPFPHTLVAEKASYSVVMVLLVVKFQFTSYEQVLRSVVVFVCFD